MNEEAKTTAAKAPEKVTYARERLIAEARARFDQPSSVVAGALAHGRNGSKVHFSLDEAEKAIDEHLDHEVEFDGVQGQEV